MHIFLGNIRMNVPTMYNSVWINFELINNIIISNIIHLVKQVSLLSLLDKLKLIWLEFLFSQKNYKQKMIALDYTEMVALYVSRALS